MRIEFKPLLLTEQADIFSIRIDNETQSEFEKFYILFKDTQDEYLKDDLNRILATIEAMGEKGILENKFRPEGTLSDRVLALPLLTIPRNVQKHGTLRLYCVRVSERLLVIGSGDIKRVQSYEEDETLSAHVDLLRRIDKQLDLLEEEGRDLSSALLNITLDIN